MNSLDWYGHNIENIVFQWDSDFKHTWKRVQKWFDTQEIEVLQWPAQFLDLNAIEHLWFYLEYKELAGKVEELWERTQMKWKKISKKKVSRIDWKYA